MNRSPRPLRVDYRWVGAAVLALAALAAGLMISASKARSDGTPVLTVERAAVGPAISSGFVGLSMEFRGLEAYAGQDPSAIDPAFVALLRNLAPGQRPVLRIGGDGTDWTWYPVANQPRPPGVKYDLTPTWLQVGHALASALDLRLILGINLEANSRPVAAGEARALIGGLGRRAVDALEIGNEPELYGSFSWYKNAAGHHVTGRPRGYAFTNFLHDFSSFAAALPRVPLAGPSSGSPIYMAGLRRFLRAEPRVKLVTLHSYPLKHCRRASHVTTRDLLSDSASAGLAASLAPAVSVARRHGVGVRLDEINAVSCGGERGVSDTFASALWALDALFEMARIGVGGVNIHTVPGTINEVIGTRLTGGHWQADVHPEYYGMMMFAQAARPGSRLLRLSWGSNSAIKAWATRSPDGVVRVVLINRQAGPQSVKLRIPSHGGPATLERLAAPSLHAKSSVTIGGQGFGAQSNTGVLTGAVATPISPESGAYTVTLPSAGAALVTVP